ncbi:MAG: hypothetical protein RL653_154 [Pseudomonadota bacterium]|jgi:hypothetical protein
MSFRAASLLGLLCASGAAWGHGVPAGTATLRLNGDRVFAVFSVPVTLLGPSDEDGNGQLSLAELERHRADITAVVRTLVRVESGLEKGEVTFEDLLVPHAEADGAQAAAATHLGVMRSTRFPGPVRSARLVLEVFSAEPEARVEAAFLDERGTLLERATLSRAVPAYRFGARAPEVAWMHAAAAGTWVAQSPWAWGLLLVSLLAGAVFGGRPRRAVGLAAGAGAVLILSRAVVVQAAFGRELPHDVAAGLGTTLVLTACSVAALGVGLKVSIARRRAVPGGGGDLSRAA